ncbi:hypothetical protein KP509_34G018200 [Ceratopteris richardii]|uniref:Uncharacterized protein n=1 Tax=Ceratopteris richardii TaxID=49495 RepID=A0A8T2QHR0_CERRI|nr:hypothetical protein KP509_34G018200 [Ceratopteris richardii]
MASSVFKTVALCSRCNDYERRDDDRQSLRTTPEDCWKQTEGAGCRSCNCGWWEGGGTGGGKGTNGENCLVMRIMENGFNRTNGAREGVGGCSRERLQRHRLQVAGKLRIPESWSGEARLREWADPADVDETPRPADILAARAALVSERRLRRRLSSGSSTIPLTATSSVISSASASIACGVSLSS